MSEFHFGPMSFDRSAANFADGGEATVINQASPGNRTRDGEPLDGIFISYRRQDSAHAAGRLAAHLREHAAEFRLFIDVQSIQPGADIARRISEELLSSFLALILIGSNWSGPTAGRSRLADPHDYVRREVQSALAAGIHVLPVLIDEAQMPDHRDLPEAFAELPRRHATRLHHHSFDADAHRIVSHARGLRGGRRE